MKNSIVSFKNLESANRHYNSNRFPDRSGPSTSASDTLSLSTSGARFFSTAYDPYCKPPEYFQQRNPNSFYGGNYQDPYRQSTMNCSPQQQYHSASSHDQSFRGIDPNSPSNCTRRLPKKKKRSGRGKKNSEEADEDVRLKENGEWDADFHFFGVKSPTSKTVRASELLESTKLWSMSAIIFFRLIFRLIKCSTKNHD